MNSNASVLRGEKDIHGRCLVKQRRARIDSALSHRERFVLKERDILSCLKEEVEKQLRPFHP